MEVINKRDGFATQWRLWSCAQLSAGRAAGVVPWCAAAAGAAIRKESGAKPTGHGASWGLQVREQGNLSYLCIPNVLLAARGRRMHTVNYMAKYPAVFFNKERRKTRRDLRVEAVQLAGSFCLQTGTVLPRSKNHSKPSKLANNHLAWWLSAFRGHKSTALQR